MSAFHKYSLLIIGKDGRECLKCYRYMCVRYKRVAPTIKMTNNLYISWRARNKGDMLTPTPTPRMIIMTEETAGHTHTHTHTERERERERECRALCVYVCVYLQEFARFAADMNHRTAVLPLHTHTNECPIPYVSVQPHTHTYPIAALLVRGRAPVIHLALHTHTPVCAHRPPSPPLPSLPDVLRSLLVWAARPPWRALGAHEAHDDGGETTHPAAPPWGLLGRPRRHRHRRRASPCRSCTHIHTAVL